MTKLGMIVAVLFFLLANSISFVIGGFGGFYYCRYQIIKYISQMEQSQGSDTWSKDSSEFRSNEDFHGTSL